MQHQEKHELNQTAHKILQVLHLRANSETLEDLDKDWTEVQYPLMTSLPILDLLMWKEGILFYQEGPASPKLTHLIETANSLPEDQAMELIAGRNQENMIHLPDLEILLWGTPKQQEQVESGLRRNLKSLLTEVNLEVPVP